MKKLGLAFCVSVAAIAATAPASAQTVVNFDQSPDAATYAAQGLVLNGFSISGETYGNAVIIPSPANYANPNDSGSSISFVDAAGLATTSNGFGFTTVGLNNGGGYFNGATLTFLGAMGEVLGNQTFDPVGPNEARSPFTYSNSFAGISSINFSLIRNGSGPGLFAIDDVTFAINPVAAAVPEPAAWAMMILGMGAVGFAMRRRQKVTTRVSYSA